MQEWYQNARKLLKTFWLYSVHVEQSMLHCTNYRFFSARPNQRLFSEKNAHTCHLPERSHFWFRVPKVWLGFSVKCCRESAGFSSNSCVITWKVFSNEPKPHVLKLNLARISAGVHEVQPEQQFPGERYVHQFYGVKTSSQTCRFLQF